MSTTAIPPRPQTMPLNPSGLPDDPILHEARCVVWGWTWTPTKEKWDKPPLRPVDGRAASVTNKADWTDLPRAVAAVRRDNWDGIGVVLEKGCGVVGIDLDKCRDPLTAAIASWAQAIIDRFRSYWEPSASGTGIRIFIRAQLPPGRRRTGQIEMYDDGRYLTINGNPGPGASRHFAERQAELDGWHAETFPAPVVHARRASAPTSTDDLTILRRARDARNGAKFVSLYDAGDFAAYGYPSGSEARLGLCSMLSYWTGPDPDTIERLFQGSALYREDKWPRERARVLENACNRTEFYDWDRAIPAPVVDAAPATLDEQDRVIAGLREQLAERDRKLAAIHELMTSEGMTPIERVIAYGVAIEAASAHSRKDEEAVDLVVNQRAIACNVNVSRQSVGKALDRWSEQGHIRKESRLTGQFSKDGDPLSETLLRLPAQTFTDNIVMATTWKRPEDTPHVGGNGHRCPACQSTKTKKTEETATMLTTVIACADCGHVHTKTGRILGETKTFVSFGDLNENADKILDLAAIRGESCSPTAPPVAEPPPLDPAMVQHLAGSYSRAVIQERLARLEARWDAGDQTDDLRLLMREWRQIAEARACLNDEALGAD